MTAIVQDDAGSIENANCYIDSVYFLQYHKTRGTKVVVDGESILVSEGAFDSVAIDAACVVGTDRIDNDGPYNGTRVNPEQTTEFPHNCLTDRRGNPAVGIFKNLKAANAEYALLELQDLLNIVPTVDSSGQQITVKREKVGPIEEETQYAVGQLGVKTFPAIDRLLADYLASPTLMSVRV